MPHQIRLAGPWEFSIDGGQNWQRCKLPFNFADAGGDECRLRRRFHRPTGLDAESSVTLKLEGKNLPDTLQLNDADVQLTRDEQSAETSNLIDSLLSFNECGVACGLESAAVLESVALQILD